jgi:nucleotide-binding universal stress UspA family protein
MYKTILVHAGGDPSSISAIQAAKALGERFEAALIGVGAANWDAYLAFTDPGRASGSGETLQAMETAIEAEIAEAKVRFHDVCAGYAHGVTWRSRMDDPARTMVNRARGADLIVAARPPKGADPQRFASPTTLVMESGLPVIVANSNAAETPIHKVLIGWKNTRETRRAISDAMPLLKLADRVHVAQICETDAVGSAKAELDDVLARLSRHGVKAEGASLPQVQLAVTDDLLDIAAKQSADLIVLGAYGHSRLREWAFGGVTKDLMESAPYTILFSR